MKRLIFLIILGGLALIAIILVVVVFLFLPIRSEVFSSAVELPPPEAGFVLISPDFNEGGPIPNRFTCNGENIPPTLAWGDPPTATKSFVLTVTDPDSPGGPWIHWIVYNLPAQIRTIDANTRPGLKINDVTILFGKNSWGKQTYGGPCPPSGTHHYVFQITALSINLGPENNAFISDLNAQMQGSILSTAKLIGTYTK
jgi:Raf kinase inhibitor-like YbhB/YbcL family protein